MSEKWKLSDMQAHEREPWVQRLRARAIVDANGCWIWQGTKNNRGYGTIQIRGRNCGVHRLMLAATLVDFDTSLLACHKCNVRACCNPEHLYAGTYTDNMRDVIRAGNYRSPVGEINRAKTHCKHGHPFDGDNVRIYREGSAGRTRRSCRACRNARSVAEQNARASTAFQPLEDVA